MVRLPSLLHGMVWHEAKRYMNLCQAPWYTITFECPALAHVEPCSRATSRPNHCTGTASTSTQATPGLAAGWR
eukprot:177557-Chlamydomonas_euryale.AAC.4